MPFIVRPLRVRIQPALAASLLVATACARVEPRSAARGTNARLALPAELAPARAWSGFENGDGSVAVRVAELHQVVPDPELAVQQVLVEKLGAALRSKEDATVAGLPAVLARIEPLDASKGWTDWQLLVFGPKDTLDVRARFPRAQERWSAPLRAALLGLEWSPGATSDVFEGPSFRLRPPKGWTRTTSVQGIYTFVAPRSGTTSAERFLDPSLTVVVESGAIDAEFLDTELVLRMQARDNAQDWSVVESTRIRVAGLPAHMLLAHARVLPEDRELFFLGVLVSGDGLTWWLHGEARRELEGSALNEVRTALLSFERLPAETVR
ncbi:MAG: hypothetical protein U1F29_15930 [Planctomycetota bacterium]